MLEIYDKFRTKHGCAHKFVFLDLETRTGLASRYFFIFANVANDSLKFLATKHFFFAKCDLANAQRYLRENSKIFSDTTKQRIKYANGPSVQFEFRPI